MKFQSALRTSERDEWEKNNLNVRRSRTQLGRPQYPAKPVRGIRPTKARSGISKG